MLHKITLKNKENDEKPYNFNQKKIYSIFTPRIYKGHCYNYNILSFCSSLSETILTSQRVLKVYSQTRITSTLSAIHCIQPLTGLKYNVITKTPIQHHPSHKKSTCVLQQLLCISFFNTFVSLARFLRPK